MKKSMKKIGIQIVATGLLGGLLAGCATTPDVVVTPGDDGMPPAIGATAPVAQPPAAPAGKIDIVRAKTPVNVESKGDREAATLVKKAVDGALMRAGFLLDPSRTAVVEVLLDSSLKQFDKFGNYEIYVATADYRVNRIGGKRLMADSLSVKGDRDLDSDQAKLSASEKLAKEVADELAAKLTPKTLGLNVATITVSQKNLERLAEEIEIPMATFLSTLVDRAGDVDGVLAFENVKRGDPNVFRVVYDTDAFPQGLPTGTVTLEKDTAQNPIDRMLISVFGKM